MRWCSSVPIVKRPMQKSSYVLISYVGSVLESLVSVGTVIGPRQLAWPLIGCGLGDCASLLYINIILTWFIIIHQLLQYFH